PLRISELFRNDFKPVRQENVSRFVTAKMEEELSVLLEFQEERSATEICIAVLTLGKTMKAAPRHTTVDFQK
ncbi:hypothetical protein U1Q18_051766, partial [Sarracenia purpurea var. burkii]